RFLAAETWDESQRIVEAHPELLSDAADERFALALEEYAGNPDAVQMLATHRALLHRCREVGIARAFAEQMLGADGLAEAERMGRPPEEFLAGLREGARLGEGENGGEGDDDPDAALPALVNRFVNLRTWDDAQRMVEENPDLLSDDADQLFGSAIE